MSETVYLLHFDGKLGNPTNPLAMAQHYIGTARDLDTRIAEHKAGSGAAITAAAVQRGIGFDVARTWTGGRQLERQLKRRKEGPRLCPRCKGAGIVH